MLIFEDKIKQNKTDFVNKVNLIAENLNTNPNYLMALMYSESRLNPAAQNLKFPLYNGPATGLIQFTPDTAQILGTSIDQLKAMSNVEQLDFVYKYFLPFKGKLTDYFNTYMACFFPAAIGKPDYWIFETAKIKRTAVAKQNPAIDLNQDGKITVAEFKSFLLKTIPAQFKNILFEVKEFLSDKKNIVTIVLIGAFILMLKK